MVMVNGGVFVWRGCVCKGGGWAGVGGWIPICGDDFDNKIMAESLSETNIVVIQELREGV